MKSIKLKNSKKIAKKFEKGGIIVMPTDTVFGIFSSIKNPNSDREINLLKGSKEEKKLTIMFSTFEEASNAISCNDEQLKVLRENLPGKTTFLLKPNQEWLKENDLERYKEKIGIRVPIDFNIVKILSITGPLFSTSLNKSGKDLIKKVSSKSDLEIFKESDVPISYYINGDLRNGKPSSIIEFDKKNDIKLIRK